MSLYARPICTLAVVGLLSIAVSACGSGSKDSKAPADKMEKMDDMKMDDKAKELFV
jgi:hypothetical protein